MENETLETVGFIGLGGMGTPMAGQLLRAGYKLTIFDSERERMHPLEAAGARCAKSPRAVADEAEIVFACLPTPHASEMVACGEDGIALGRSIRHYVECSTVGIETVKKISAYLDERSITLIDAPVSGGPPAAKNGNLSSMAAGSLSSWRVVEPMIAAYSSRRFYISDRPGAGQACKLVNNAISIATLAIACEAIVLGAVENVPLGKLIDIINASSGRCGATMEKFPNAILPRTFDFGASMRIIQKDMQLFMDEAGRMNLHTPALERITSIWSAAAATGDRERDFTTLIKDYEELAGVVVQG